MTAARLRISPREYRLVAERLLQHAGLDRGVVVPLRDFVLDAELATGRALRYLVDEAERIAACAPGPAVTLGPGGVDAAGAPALLVAPAVLDAALARRSVAVSGVHDPQLLSGLEISASRHGARLAVAVNGDDRAGVLVLDEPEGAGNSAAELLAGGDARLAAAAAGIDIDADLWWTAYRRSNLALSVDTRQSRRHAGATIVEDDGSMRGATDDEIDPTVYSGDRAALFDESREL
jgi:hypothetical protein